jgi:oligopeptide/dipeptide ABC transporter ATP-binding protein
VFQDPSINPRLSVRSIVAEPLDLVGLPATAADLYPHEFAGGQRQRIAIARAPALKPSFMVLDEPISALDVSIRAQILNLLADIQDEFGLTYLFVAHDLALMEHFSSQVGVMYLGAMAELGPTATVFARPSHPDTRALLVCVPRPDPDHRAPAGVIRGEIGSPVTPRAGCKFHPRCPHATDVCAADVPAARAAPPGQLVACHHIDVMSPLSLSPP